MYGRGARRAGGGGGGGAAWRLLGAQGDPRAAAPCRAGPLPPCAGGQHVCVAVRRRLRRRKAGRRREAGGWLHERALS